MKTHLRNVIAVLALIVVIYLATNYAGQLQQQVGVKGASTSRNQEIAGKISNDVSSQVDAAKNQAMHLNLSDIVTYVSRFKRIPQDINSVKQFAQDQVTNVLQSTDQKSKKK